MRKRLLFSVLTAVAILALVVAPAGAVMYGEPDGNGHPFVGLVVFYADEAATQPLWRCTGTLIAPKVFLTAGHCTEAPAVRAQVWFDAVVARPPYPFSGGVMGEPHPHPMWNGALTIPATHDIGVVVLDKQVKDKGYGLLPAAGALDGLATRRGLQDVSFKIVGYGLQGVKPELIGLRERYRGWTKLNNLGNALTDGYNIHLSSNPGHWSGGLCFGDSGGPVFLNGTNVVVAVNSFVLNSNCSGAGFSYRVDTADSLSFIGGFTR